MAQNGKKYTSNIDAEGYVKDPQGGEFSAIQPHPRSLKASAQEDNSKSRHFKKWPVHGESISIKIELNYIIYEIHSF